VKKGEYLMLNEGLFRHVFGRQLRLKRSERQLTLKELAERTKLDEKKLEMIQRGEIDSDAYVLFKICRVLKLSINQLFIEIKEELESLNKKV
jgi:transcriptional regulator with XRE-family HTH domain